jgi:hypothetical protein
MTDTRGNPAMLTAAKVCGAIAFVVFLLFLATSGACQGIEPSPAPSKAPMRLSLLVMGVGQGMDTVTTLQALQRGAVERNGLLGGHPPAAKLIAAKAPLAVIGWLLAKKVHPSHPKLAAGTAFVIGGVGAALAVHNSRVAR